MTIIPFPAERRHANFAKRLPDGETCQITDIILVRALRAVSNIVATLADETPCTPAADPTIGP